MSRCAAMRVSSRDWRKLFLERSVSVVVTSPLYRRRARNLTYKFPSPPRPPKKGSSGISGEGHICRMRGDLCDPYRVRFMVEVRFRGCSLALKPPAIEIEGLQPWDVPRGE